MGTKPYQGVKQTVLETREKQLQRQMIEVRSILLQQKLSDVDQLAISKLTVTQIVDKLNKKQINSQMLVAVLANRAAHVGKQLNLFTLTNFEQALKMARECDQIRSGSNKCNWTFKNNGQNSQQFLPPLFGIPISVKDVYQMKGFSSTLGLKAKVFKISQQSPLITCLNNSGTIPFIRSNVPQYCMSAQTNNNLWGRSVSPWNSGRAVGGSSGGEGGLISSGCSILGVGSDIGGSIRVPAQHCGIFGLKPSSKRISNIYHAQLSKIVTAMSLNIPLCVGPLAKSVQDLSLFMKVATQKSYYKGTQDPYTKIVPFCSKKYALAKQKHKKFRIGIVKSLADIEVSPTSARALLQTTQILQKLGHQMIQISIPNQKQLIRQYLLQISPGNSHYIRQILAGQQPSQENKAVLSLLQMSGLIKMMAKFYLKRAIPSAYFFSFSKQIPNVLEYQRHVGYIYELKNKWIKYWNQKQLDFVICPGFPCQAIPHGQSNKLGYVLAYTFIWNILDMTVGSMPVTTVKQNQQFYQCQSDNMFTQQLKKCAVGSAGLPAGVQIVGLPYHQEQVLGLMHILQKQIKFNEKYPLPIK